ncbi:hypothetical protein [Paraburkholderia megapolitana]|uniref:hypothetical protein n=1 Tax=Paraburkholderia megapolitana TaxID=420953 RepID=UPI0038BBEA71
MTSPVSTHRPSFPPPTRPAATGKAASTTATPAASNAQASTEAAGSAAAAQPSLPTGLVGRHVDTTA